jgi:acetyl esterase
MNAVSKQSTPAAPLDPALEEIQRRWKDAGIPDLYAGLDQPWGGVASRERARNVRALLYPSPILPTGAIENLEIPGPGSGGQPAIPLRIVWPHASFGAGKATSTLVFFHGGGWVVGDLDSHAAHAIRLANEAQCVVVSVDYRLAPEHKFPAAYDDCLAATLWAHSHIGKLGGNPRRFALAGDSAGGNLAAATAIACRDRGISLAAQLLIYPATNIGNRKSAPEYAYLGENIDALALDPRVSAFHAKSHVGLAPAIIGVGRYDFLYQDNVAYAEVLRQAKVPLTYREYATLNHGFFSFTSVSKASEAAALQLCHDLKAHFERAGQD